MFIVYSFTSLLYVCIDVALWSCEAQHFVPLYLNLGKLTLMSGFVLQGYIYYGTEQLLYSTVFTCLHVQKATAGFLHDPPGSRALNHTPEENTAPRHKT